LAGLQIGEEVRILVEQERKDMKQATRTSEITKQTEKELAESD
jgi:hypothetical protein